MERRMMILSETFPDDLVIEILKRMPVRSLLRFKSVSKSWYFQISDPQFTKIHFDLAAAPTHRILYYHQNEFKARDTEASLYHDSAEVVISTPSPSFIFKYRYDMTKTIRGSCRGFILFEHTTKNTFFFDVWNPSTGLHKQILLKRSKREKKKKSFSHTFGIGYDSSIDDYLIVAIMLLRSQNITQFINVQIQIFSFRTNSWSCTKSIVREEFISAAFNPGLFFNGALHWLVNIKNEFQVYYFAKIITFDLRNRRLSEIPLPRDMVIDSKRMFFCLTIVRECLCVFSQGFMPTEWWIMKEYNVESSWTKFFTLSSDYYAFFFPVCFTKTDEILGSDPNELVRINKEGKQTEHRSIETMITFCHPLCCTESLLSLPASCYTESLLSLPGVEEAQQ